MGDRNFMRLYLEIVWNLIIGLPKTIYLNFKCLPFKQAIKLPILVSSKVVIRKLTAKIELHECKTGVIRLGFGNVGIFDRRYSRSIIEAEGKIIFYGATRLGNGFKLIIGKDAVIEFGKDFRIGSEVQFICNKHISLGARSMIAWNSMVMDTDLHGIYDGDTKKRINEDRGIIIGDDVWIGCRSSILKGTNIPNGSVVSSGTIVNSSINKFKKEKCILGGNPIRVLKEDVYWEN